MDTLIFILFLYFIPSFVAGLRYHKNINSILALNFFLGWTIIGWVVSLVWSLSAKEGKPDKSSRDPAPEQATTYQKSIPDQTEIPLPIIQFPDDPPKAVKKPETPTPKNVEQDWVRQAREELKTSRRQ